MSIEQSNPTTAAGSESDAHKTLDGQGLRKLIEAGLTWLRTNHQTVNALNVFPVPDGDTGTNMVLTMQAAYDEISSSGESNIGRMAHDVAQGALMGARGNSGVILSQIWRGFARSLDNLPTMDANLIVNALAESRNTAYKGVVRPVEGTILTVIKDIASAVEAAHKESDDLGFLLGKMVAAADESVQHTPELLPVLKQAGVVDSGGKGLFYILEGMLRSLNGLPLDVNVSAVQPISAMLIQQTAEEIEPGQDYEVVVDFQPSRPLDIEQFFKELTDIGTSIQIGEGDGMYRMHIHVTTEKRYTPIDYIMGLGTITKVAMENLMAQMEEIEKKKQAPKLNLASVQPGQIAVVVVAPGPGISRIFASLGAAAIIEGGQTMNPSTEEILASFENLPTDQVIILPNNKNIILAAQNSAEVTVKQVKVIPCRSVPQGISAIFCHNPDGDLDEIAGEMIEAITEVRTGEITSATRSVELNGVKVEQGEVIALLDGEIVVSADSIDKATLSLLKKADTDERERITLFYGDNIQRTEVNRIVDLIREEYPSHEIELHEGGQPHYQFIIAIE